MMEGKIKSMPPDLQNTVAQPKESETNLEEKFGKLDLKMEKIIKEQKQNTEIHEYLNPSKPIEEETKTLPNWDEVDPNKKDWKNNFTHNVDVFLNQ